MNNFDGNNGAILGNNRSILGEILNRIIGKKNRIIGTALITCHCNAYHAQ